MFNIYFHKNLHFISKNCLLLVLVIMKFSTHAALTTGPSGLADLVYTNISLHSKHLTAFICFILFLFFLGSLHFSCNTGFAKLKASGRPLELNLRTRILHHNKSSLFEMEITFCFCNIHSLFYLL